jgi:site-specific DNA recombinase
MRPEFLRMKKDIEVGKIDVVISKDCSRFGRNIATEVYFSEIFPKHGTYFIGVIDNIDTSNESQVLERQIRGMMNENYSRDISLKVRSALYAMMSEGKYVGGNPPYGFIRDPNDKHKLLVDENVRHVILRIADLYLQGNGFQTVAKILNDDEDRPPAPSVYRKMEGSKFYSKNAWRGLWSVSTVRKILTEEIYNSTLVQGNIKKVPLPPFKCFNL